jgi:flagella basal body P-ring formation protein FlgA
VNFTPSSWRPRPPQALRSLARIAARTLRGLGLALGLASLPALVGMAGAQARSPALAESLKAEVLDLVRTRVVGPATPRVEITLGQLDPRLRLAPCERVEPYIPQGTRLWGRARVGLRCTQGPTHWNVYLPVTVDVFGPGFVAARPLPAGHVITQADLRPAEINLGEHRSPAIGDAALAVGRTLAQALPAGESLRQAALRSRQWFAPGDTVKVRALGNGFAITGSGQALAAGLEGQNVRIRTDSGKVVTGQPVDEGVVEITL